MVGDNAFDFVVHTFGKAVKASTLPALCEATRLLCFFQNFWIPLRWSSV